MLNKLKGEKGYALLVVVLLVALIMVLFTTFISTSLSTAKQEKYTEDHNLLIAAAEMGVEYYVTAVTNEYAELYDEIDKSEDQEDELDRFSEELEDRITENIDIAEFKNTKIGYGYQLVINNDFGETAGDIQIGGKSIGKSLNDDRSHTINFSVELPFPKLVGATEPEDGTEGGNGSKIDLDSIPFKMPNEHCNKDNNSAYLNGCYENNYTVGNNFKPIGWKLHVVNDFKTNNNNFEPQNTNLYVGGTLDTKNNFKPTDSNLYVAGDFFIKNNLDSKGTNIFVEGNFQFGPNGMLDIGENTNICIKGDVYFGNDNKEEDISKVKSITKRNNSNIFVLKKTVKEGDKDINEEYESKGVTVIKDLKALESECGFSNDLKKSLAPLEGLIDPEKVNVEYEY